MKRYDWLRNGFFTGWGQGFSDGELQAWRKKNDMDANMATLLARATSNPQTRNFTSRELQLEAL
jgi:hypothetical protein